MTIMSSWQISENEMKKIFAFLLLAGIFLLPSPIHAAGTTCMASTTQEVSQCVNQLNAGSITTIEVTAKINCTVDNPCKYNITTTKGGLIFGTPGADAGFYRSGDYLAGAFGAPVFKIANASNLTISDLVFNDDKNSPNCPYNGNDFWTNPKCFDQIKIDNSNGIFLKQLYLTGSKYHPISIDNSNNITITNSRVELGYLRGIRMSKVDTAQIEGNYIVGNGGAGVVTDYAKNTIIKNNFLSHNQSPPWNIGGGQINFGGENSTIIGNTIVDSSVGEFYGCGIELHTEIANLTVRDNDFERNNGADICNNTGVPLSNLVAENNKFLKPLLSWANWVPGTSKEVDPSPWNSAIWDLGKNNNGWVIKTNCFNGDTSCTLPALGTLSVDPNPCIIGSGQTTCSVAISWFIGFAGNMEIKVGSNTFANWAMGFRRVVNGITTSPTPITISGDGHLLASVNVSGLTQGTAKPADLNNDGKIDIYDYNLLVANFGKTGSNITGDIDHNGRVDIYDYNELVANFGK